MYRPPLRALLAMAITIALWPADAQAQSAPPEIPSAPAPSQTTAKPSSERTSSDKKAADAEEIDTIIVLGYRLNLYQGQAEFDNTFIDALPRGNGDLGTLLRIHPNVQFDERASNSNTPGEIRSAEISINGAPYYQNAFRVDGVNFTNDLDPATKASANSYADVPSGTQGLALDTSLVERITVYDSNVPAAFGRFNGGVVDAVTRNAKDQLSGSLALRTTRSDWTQYKVSASDRPSFELSTTEDQQPQFEKWDLRTRLEGRMNNGLGIAGRINVVRSEIPLRAYVNDFRSNGDESQKDMVRQNVNASLKMDWVTPGGIELEASTIYAPTDERYFIQNARDSYFDIRQGGPVLSAKVGFERNGYRMQARLSHSDLDSSRRSDADYFRNWNWSPDKGWGNPNRSNPSSIEGAWGDIDQRQRESAVQLSVNRDPLRWGVTAHQLSAGVEFTRRYAEYRRLQDHIVDFRPTPTNTCTATNGVVDTVACSLSPTIRNGRGQYLAARDIYRAGDFRVEADDYAVYLQDDIEWGRVQIRAGLRLEGDDYMRQRTVSPRLAFAWDLFGNGDSRLTAGVNRYFGRTFFGNALREGRDALRLSFTRGTSLVYGPATTSASLNRFVELDIPYTDERTVGLDQNIGGFNLGLKWVGRSGRDEILRRRVRNTDPAFVSNVFEYTNTGRSRSDTYTLNFAPQAPWEWGPSRHHWFLAADWTDVRRNYNDYNSSLDPIEAARTVLYNGDRIRFDELPAGNFNRPWSARLATRSDLPRWGLTMSHFFRYRAGYRDVGFVETRVIDGESVDVYADSDFDDTWTLDSSLEWERKVKATWTVFSRLEVTNVTNRTNTSRTSSGARVFETGRQYWLELGLRF
jgi:hypothetical protein